MTAANLDHQNLDDVKTNGMVRESVMQKVWDISRIPLALTDRIGTGTHSNRKVEFTTDELGDPETDNAHVDGVDIDQNDSSVGEQIGRAHV